MAKIIKDKKSGRGITMVEMVIALGIFCLIGVAILGWQKDLFYINTLLNKRLESQEDARKVIKNFTAELRTSQISDDGNYCLGETNKDSLIFYSDIDNDGKKEKIRYFLDNSSINKKLKKGITKSTGQPPVYNPNNETIITVAQNIINPNDEIFLYYDQNYDGTTSPLNQPVVISLVRLIKITLTIDEDSTRPPAPFTETTQISIRNLKNNL